MNYQPNTSSDNTDRCKYPLKYRYGVNQKGEVYDLQQYNNHHRKNLRRTGLKTFRTMDAAQAYAVTQRNNYTAPTRCSIPMYSILMRTGGEMTFKVHPTVSAHLTFSQGFHILTSNLTLNEARKLQLDFESGNRCPMEYIVEVA